MTGLLKGIGLGAMAILAAPLLLPYALTDAKPLIRSDMARWIEHEEFPASASLWGLMLLLGRSGPFRNAFYYRVLSGNGAARPLVYLLRPLYFGMPALYIRRSAHIGPGLYVQHGFATVVNGQIGKNFWVNQQVTIGHKDVTGLPTIGDDVHVGAGAKILGKISIGDNVIVGANAVVTKDVPSNCVVGGVPARVLRHLDPKAPDRPTA